MAGAGDVSAESVRTGGERRVDAPEAAQRRPGRHGGVVLC